MSDKTIQILHKMSEIHSFILLSGLGLSHGLFQSGLSSKRDLVRPVATSSILSFP